MRRHYRWKIVPKTVDAIMFSWMIGVAARIVELNTANWVDSYRVTEAKNVDSRDVV